MLLSRFALVSLTFACMLLLKSAGLDVVSAGIVTFMFILCGYILLALMMQKRRQRLLLQKCDPYVFYEQTLRAKKRQRPGTRASVFLTLDESAALIAQGKFQQAIDLLSPLGEKDLPIVNGLRLLYYMNLTSAHLGLENKDEVERIFETQLPLLPPVSDAARRGIQLLMAQRLILLGRPNEAPALIEPMLLKSPHPYNTASVHYVLGKAALSQEDHTAVQAHLEKTVEHGNRLYIAQVAKQLLERIND